MPIWYFYLFIIFLRSGTFSNIGTIRKDKKIPEVTCTILGTIPSKDDEKPANNVA